MGSEPLTTTEAATLVAVAPSTIKRWADQGALPFVRTRGGHRRFERFAVEEFVRGMAGAHADEPAGAWIQCLVGAQRHEVDGRLLEARARLGSWCLVADEVGRALF